jgi:hypothetical protein
MEEKSQKKAKIEEMRDEVSGPYAQVMQARDAPTSAMTLD